MRYGIIPTRLAERLALWFGRVPLPIADCLLPLLQTRSLMAAVRLGVMEALGEGEHPAAQIAQACGADRTVLEMLLRVLVSSGYVRARDGRYGLTALGRRTLLPGAPDEARAYVLWNYVQWDLVGRLEEVVRTGRGVDFHETLRGEQQWEWYQEAMLNLARAAAPVVARLVPVKKGARTLVDVGGSHGLLGAAVCRRHPPMRSVVLELPAALDQARSAASKAGTDGFVEHETADVLVDRLPSADVVLLANILHHFRQDETMMVLGRAREALSRRGTIAVWEFDRPEPDAPAELAADASALYFRLTSSSDVVPGDQYASWLREAGFKDVRLRRSTLAPFQVLAVGRT